MSRTVPRTPTPWYRHLLRVLDFVVMLPLNVWGYLWFELLIWPLLRRGWRRAAWAANTLSLAVTFELCHYIGIAVSPVLNAVF